MTPRERKALLYFAAHARYQLSGGRYSPWRYRMWWKAIDLLPVPAGMLTPLAQWPAVAESLAYEGTAVLR